jgi:hypothetical protein
MKKMKKLKLIPILMLLLALSSCTKDENKPNEPDNSQKYTNFKITSIKITSMPFTDGAGSSWDIADGPDVFFKITDSGGSVLFDRESSRITNVTSVNLPLLWNFSSSFNITNISVYKNIEVYDYDTIDPNDYISLVSFRMEDYKSTYPSSITKTYGSLTVTINGSWY